MGLLRKLLMNQCLESSTKPVHLSRVRRKLPTLKSRKAKRKTRKPMSKKIILSYSTLADLKKWKHSWINKMLGLPKKEFEFLKEGKEIHKVLLGHMAGVQPDERIMKREANGGDFQLPKLEVYEKVDFDPDTKKYFDVDDKYSMVTFVDGLNLTESFILEVKTSSKAWTPGMYRDLMQRKIYSIAFPGLKRSFLVSSGR